MRTAVEEARIRRALISVSDKSGLIEFARFLVATGVDLLSTGGSARTLSEANVPVTEVSRHTGFPEILDGRVKTLHPLIHGGLLARRDDALHEAAMREHGIAPIDLLAVNLYPFEDTVAGGAGFEDSLETIDIGGPALIRAAAKNHAFVTVVVDPDDYSRVMDAMRETGGAIPPRLRRELAALAFGRTAAYDAAIGAWFHDALGEPFPRFITFAGRRRQLLRYGENPHQRAAFYAGGLARPGVATARQLQGKELSYNNLNDTDAAFELVAEFTRGPAAAIIKHANPSGVAVAASLEDAYLRARACDPVSAFGGIVAVNRALDAATARRIVEVFAEVVIAPDVDEDARAVLAGKPNVRVLATGAMPDPGAGGVSARALAGGYLVQERDTRNGAGEPQVVTRRRPSERERADLSFAFLVAKHVKSNAIVYAKDSATVGIGAGPR